MSIDFEHFEGRHDVGRGEGLAGLVAARIALEFVDRLYSTKGGVINSEHYGLIANSNECGQMINAVRDAVRKLAALEAAARLPAPRVPDDLVKEIIADALVGTHGYGGSLERARMDIANRIEKWLAALKYYASHADGGTGVAEAALATPSPQAPVQLSVPAQDERPVIETANLVTPVDVGPGYCEDSPFSINRATLAQSLKGPGPLAVAIMSGATGKPNQPLEEWLAAQDVFLSERHLDAVKSYIVMNLLPVVPAATQEQPAGSEADAFEALRRSAEQKPTIAREADGMPFADLPGSPHKVGEDGDSHLPGRIAARLDEYKFVEQMISGVEKEDWFKRRVANLESMYAASSVPVGEQK